MPLKTELQVSAGVLVISCVGRITFGNETELLGQQIGELLREHRRIVVHLGGIENMDGGDIRPLALTALLAQATGCEVRFAQLPERIAVMLRMAKILDAFGVYETTESALQAFREGPTPQAQETEPPLSAPVLLPSSE
jgi:anti-anti-sigma regulatory factor